MTTNLNTEAIEFLKMISEVLIDESSKLEDIQNGSTSLSHAVLNTNNLIKKTKETVDVQSDTITLLHENVADFVESMQTVEALLSEIKGSVNGNDETIQFLAEALNKLTDSRQEELTILVEDHEAKVDANLQVLAEVLNKVHKNIDLLDKTDDLSSITNAINALTTRITELDSSQKTYDDNFDSRVKILTQNTQDLTDNIKAVQDRMSETIDIVQQIGAKMLIIESRVNSLSNTDALKDLEHLVESEL